MSIREVVAMAIGFVAACASISLGAFLRGMNAGWR